MLYIDLYLNKCLLGNKNVQHKFGDKPKTNLKLNKTTNPYDADDSDPEDIPSSYTQVSIQVTILLQTKFILCIYCDLWVTCFFSY